MGTVENALDLLKKCIGSNDPRASLKYITNISTYLENNLTGAEKDHVLELLFNDINGTTVFLGRSLKCNKLFKDSNVEMFALYRKLISTSPEKMRKYVQNIYPTVLLFITANNVSAREKEFGIIVFQELATQKLYSEIMIDNLIEQLVVMFGTNCKELPARFMQGCFELFGLLAKIYPECFSSENVKTFRDILFFHMEKMLVKQEKISYPILTGIFQSFDYLFMNFALDPNEEPIQCKKIYDSIKKVSDPGELKERSTFRASLNLLTHHSTVISAQLYEDHQYWQQLLCKWMTWKYEDRRIAIMAIQSLYKEIAEQTLKKNVPNDPILKYYLKHFKVILLSQHSKTYQIRIGIRGIGLMIGPCSKLLPPEYIQDLLTLVIQRIEYGCSAIEDQSSKKEILEHLPDFIQALSQIMSKIDALSGLQIISLQNIIITLIHDFHFLSSLHHELVIESLMRTFYNLTLLNGNILDKILERVILKGVIWTCSHKLLVEVDWTTYTDWKDNLTFKNYLPLWLGLLRIQEFASYDRQSISKRIYDNLIITLFKVLDKLNLKTTKRIFKDSDGKDQELYFCDPNIDLSPVKPKDFQIFFNMVDFYKEIFKEQRIHVVYDFDRWTQIYLDKMMKKSLEYPLISGFLKFLSLGLKISVKLNYFSFDNLTPDRHSLFRNMLYFIKTIIFRARQTHGELQLSCVLLIFAAPIDILVQFPKLDEIFLIAFDIGKSMIWLANYAINVLEKLKVRLDGDRQRQEKLFETILPQLDSFLLSKNLEDKSHVRVSIEKYRSTKKIVKHIATADDEDGELLKLQKRILLFLGTIEPSSCLYLLPKSDDTKNLTKWSANQFIQISLDVEKPISIYLDNLLPNITNLALTSSNRKIKMAACELTHACILYLLGTNNHRDVVWKQLCRVSFQLGVDSDTAVQEMFEPLLMQMMHYLSKTSEINEEGVEILLDCIFDLISHPSNCGLRDLAARCLREFVIWAIRQSSSTALHSTNNDENITSTPVIVHVIDRISNLCFDSNPFRLIGASVAFNNMYRVLREERTILNIYWLEFVSIFSSNFLITEEFSADLEQIKSTMDHLTRVICEQNTIFASESPHRRNISAFEPCNLTGVLLWMVRQTGSRAINYRRKMMEIFIKIIEVVDIERNFVTTNYTPIALNNIVETEIASHSDIRSYVAAPHSISKVIIVRKWFEYFLKSLDCYTWIMSEELFSAPSFLSEMFQQSVIFKTINYYLAQLCWSTVDSILDRYVDDNQPNTILFVEEKFKIKNLKCNIIIMIVQFLIKLLEKCPTNVNPIIWTIDLQQLLIDLIFGRDQLDFDVGNREVMLNLPRIIEKLATSCNAYAYATFKENVNSKINAIMQSKLEQMIPLDAPVDVQGVQFVLINRKLFGFTPDDLDNFQYTSTFTILKNLFDSVHEMIRDVKHTTYPDPLMKAYLNEVMEIVLIFNPLNQLLSYLFNIESLATGKSFDQSESKIAHGIHFLEIYRQPIFTYAFQNSKTFITATLKSLAENDSITIIEQFTQFCDFVFTNKANDPVQLKQMVDSLLSGWEIFAKVASGHPMILIEFMSNLAMISCYPLEEIGKKAIGFPKWLLDLIKSTEISFEMKARALFLLPCVTGPIDYENPELMQSLEQLQSQHFPLRSAEYLPDSLERSGYIVAVNNLLDAFIASKSPLLLRFLINATAADPKHVIEWRFTKSINDFMRNKRVNAQVDCINLAFNVFCNESLDGSLRLNVLKRFVLTTIRSSYVNAIINFYKENVVVIDELTKKPIRGTSLESGLVSRIGGWQLIELLFATVKSDILLDPESLVARAYFDKIGGVKSLLWKIWVKSGHSARENICPPDVAPTIAELYRRYHCHVYSALISVISNTQTDFRLYQAILFKENPTKNQMIWKNVINTLDNQLYIFGQDFEVYPKLKDRIVAIQGIGDREIGGRRSKNYQYIQSATVFESSLSQDVTRLDLTNSIVRTVDQVENMSTDSEEQQHKIPDSSTFELEKMSVNQHELMANLCALVQHMIEKKITPEGSMCPEWISALVASMNNRQNHKNIRIFLAKLIDNCRMYFRAYAKFLLAPILQVIVDECVSDSGMNSFVTDLLAMILSWNDVHCPSTTEEVALASDLLKYLMKNAHHDRREIFKLNLELIKTVVELWKSVLNIPKQLLYDSLVKSSTPPEKVCGIQLNAIVLANEIVPWTDATRIMFIRAIFTSLNDENSKVYRPASELIGLTLCQIVNLTGDRMEIDGNDGGAEDEPVLKELKRNLFDIRKGNEKRSMDILYGIQKHFPPILDDFLPIICNAIPRAIGSEKRTFLEMLLSRIETFGDDVYVELMSLNLRDLFKQSEYQHLCLHLVNRVIAKFSVSQISSSLIEDVIGFVKSKNRDCREVAFEILIYLYDNANWTTDEGRALATKCLKNMMYGLSDRDPLIQSRFIEYWSSEIKMSKDLMSRLEILLDHVYDPDIEKNFLNYCTVLMLEPMIREPKAKEQIFPYRQAADYKLTEYSIDTKWQSQNTNFMSPLFVESQQKKLIEGDVNQLGNYLRATQQTDLLFEPTQDPNMILPSATQFSISSQSALPFDTQHQVLDRRSQKIRNLATKSTYSNLEQKFRRRFIRDVDQNQKEQAVRAVERREFQQSKVATEMRRKEKEVFLYRRYRFGDYPDLLINTLALLMPLQGLVKYDHILARQMFVSICVSIASYEPNFRPTLNTSIDGILNVTRQCDPIFFGALMEVSMTDPRLLQIQPEVVKTCALACNMITPGVLLLENRIECGFDDNYNSSRSSSSSTASDMIYWAKLAELYNGLSETDVVESIYSDKLRSNPVLLKGIQHENESNFGAAQTEYLKIIRGVQSNPYEQDFCYQSLYNCMVHMGDWENLSTSISAQVSSFDEFWSDWNRENFMPHYIRSQLHLILTGDATNREFLEVMESWLKNSERLDYLTANFGEEIMMMQVANQKYLQARVFSEKLLKYFLSDWVQLSTLPNILRTKKLLEIRNIAEIHRYLDDLIGGDNSVSPDNRLASRWVKSIPQLSDSILLWDKILTYRSTVITSLPDQSTAIIKKLKTTLDDIMFGLLEVADHQNYTNMYENIVLRLSHIRDNDAKSMEWYLAKCKIHVLKSRMKTDPKQKIKLLVRGWTRIKQITEHQSISEHLNVKVKGMHAISGIGEEILMLLPILEEEEGGQLPIDLELVSELVNSNEFENINQKICGHSLWCLEESIRIAESTETTQQTWGCSRNELLSDAYFKVAQFCMGIQGKEYMPNTIELEKKMITSTLRSMKYDSIEGRRYFPQILQLDKLKSDTELQALFHRETEDVPDWMFISWISQILAHFDFDHPTPFDDLLIRLSESFPNALFYPFKLSFDQYMEINDWREDTNIIIERNVVNRLKNNLKNPTVNTFIENIALLCMPAVKFRFHLEKLLIVVINDRQNFTRTKLEKQVNKINRIVFNVGGRNLLSKYYTELVQIQKQFLNSREYDPQSQEGFNKIFDQLKEVNSSLQQIIKRSPKTIPIKLLSHWMAEFKSFNSNQPSLELPGQYDGDCQPMPQSHVRITKFGKTADIFQSLRRPMKIVCHGDNGQSYDFLVKYGEDLRLDERFQKLFRLMNKQMHNDKNCVRHNLRIDGFNVIPIGLSYGMCSWIENTQTLHQFVSGGRQNNFNAKLGEAHEKYMDYINRPSPQNQRDTNAAYWNAVENYSRMKIITQFNEVRNILQPDLLKMAIIEISNSPESYYVLRSNYATSLAVNSIVIWLLGIGDRNMSNIMINIKTGHLINIDFDRSFGMGIRELGIPELMPFRLTPQMVNTMQPFGISGILFKCMVHSLRCFVDAKKHLLNYLEIFVKEPRIDWFEATRDRENNINQFEGENFVWDANGRIEIVKRKLSGENPYTISIYEISHNVIITQRPNTLKNYTTLLSGDPQTNVRARLPEMKLSIEDQVNVLVDMATDSAILGITFKGFSPFV